MSNKDDFILERYKYVLERKHSLNEATFKITAIYQAIIVALGLAQFNVISMLNSKKITLDLAKLSSQCLLFMLAILTALILALLIGGIYSWLKYRADEKELEEKVLGTSREATKFRNILSWYETYIALTVIIVFALSLWAYFEKLVPLLEVLGAR